MFVRGIWRRYGIQGQMMLEGSVMRQYVISEGESDVI